jgi:hypothetical protein
MRDLRMKLAVALFTCVLFTSSGTYAAAQGCSSKSLEGGYGFTVTGTNTALSLQFAISGRFVADGNGNFSGKATESVGGSVSQTPFTGRYEIQADCTGNALFQFSSGITSLLSFVLVDNGAEIYIMDQDDGTIETGTAKKQVVK